MTNVSFSWRLSLQTARYEESPGGQNPSWKTKTWMCSLEALMPSYISIPHHWQHISTHMWKYTFILCDLFVCSVSRCNCILTGKRLRQSDQYLFSHYGGRKWRIFLPQFWIVLICQFIGYISPEECLFGRLVNIYANTTPQAALPIYVNTNTSTNTNTNTKWSISMLIQTPQAALPINVQTSQSGRLTQIGQR